MRGTRTDRQQRLILTVNTRAVSKVSVLQFLNHLSNSAIGEYVACMDQPVEHFGRLLD
jgi:hypothetical protein